MKNRRNRGSAVIELSLLMPFLLGVIYLYIMMFLFFIGSAKRMEMVAEELYRERTESVKEVTLRTEGEMRIGTVEQEERLFMIQVELRQDKNDPVKNIRRWQLIGDVF